eukprot:NODE_37903_length_174_cov_0.816000_g36733_i0.p4 GENE.NODE_37903_length_174_cov_0.816000_g36733_i0~~NODE_37903_length_174_cov_0.816000_g36733_i0.p4  ORF type:complete len:56 (-),score=13.44 NODE_37903_length_174_cov_0.816000_g36733_i0:6-146(-)
MVYVGGLMNLLCIGVVALAVHTWGYAMFDLGTYPDWAVAGTNCTAG